MKHTVENKTQMNSGIQPIPSAIFLCAALLSLFSCQKQVDWTQFRGEMGSGRTSNSIFPPLGIRWNLTLQAENNAKSFNQPIVKDDVIYFGSNDGNFYAQDVDSGYMKWIFSTKGSVNSIASIYEDTIYFGSNDGRIYSLDRLTGEEKWNFNSGNTVQSLVFRNEDYVIFTSDTGATYFLSPDGNEIHRIPNPNWSHHTFQVYDNIIYWAPKGRDFGAYDIDQQRFLWVIEVDAPYALWYSFPALDEKRVYYASNFLTSEGSLLSYYAVDRMTGERIWQMESYMDIGDFAPYNTETLFMRHVALLDYLAPALWKNHVIFTSGDVYVRSFNAETGEEQWTQNFDYPTSSGPTVAGDRVYFGIRGDEVSPFGSGEPPSLVCLSAKTGRVLWKMPVDGAILSSPVISGKRIFFGTETNHFYVMEEIF